MWAIAIILDISSPMYSEQIPIICPETTDDQNPVDSTA